MIFIPREEAFQCENCQKEVQPLGEGTCRNHCPKCLWSKHVDEEGPGDRSSECHGLMRPVSVEQKHGEWVLLHRCERCGREVRNKTAVDDDTEVMAEVVQGARS